MSFEKMPPELAGLLKSGPTQAAGDRLAEQADLAQRAEVIKARHREIVAGLSRSGSIAPGATALVVWRTVDPDRSWEAWAAEERVATVTWSRETGLCDVGYASPGAGWDVAVVRGGPVCARNRTLHWLREAGWTTPPDEVPLPGRGSVGQTSERDDAPEDPVAKWRRVLHDIVAPDDVLTDDELLDRIRSAVDRATPATGAAFWDHLRDDVKWFAMQMEATLRANDHKDGWATSPSMALLSRLRDEVDELAAALDNDEPDGRIIAEAVDVGNFAMMLAYKARPVGVARG